MDLQLKEFRDKGGHPGLEDETQEVITEMKSRQESNDKKMCNKNVQTNYSKERPWRNNEGYCDPTASAALRNIEREEKREERKNRTIIYRKAYA